MKILGVVLVLFCSHLGYSQGNLDNQKSLNGLELGTPLEELLPNLYLITGKESAYENFPSIAENVQKNIEKGIQEAIYEGHVHRILNGRECPDLRLHFFQSELYKIRWTLDQEHFPNLESEFEDMKSYLIRKFGKHTNAIFQDTYIWEGQKYRLQLFLDEDIIQVEFRNEEIETKIKSL